MAATKQRQRLIVVVDPDGMADVVDEFPHMRHADGKPFRDVIVRDPWLADAPVWRRLRLAELAPDREAVLAYLRYEGFLAPYGERLRGIRGLIPVYREIRRCLRRADLDHP